MGPVEALRLAMSKEEEAMRMYDKLSVEHLSVKDIFIFLSGEEQKHKKLLGKKIVELTKI